MTSKRICLVRLSALGDVLMIVPLIRCLQDNFPGLELTWIISKPAYYLVEGMDGVNFIVIDKPKSIKDYLKFRKTIKKYDFDYLLAAQASMRANLLYPLIRAKIKIGYDKARARDLHSLFINKSITPGCDHTLEGFLKFAKAIGIQSPKVRFAMPLAQNDHKFAHEIIPKGDSPLVVINPAASKPERSWIAQSYIEIIKFLHKKYNARVVLTGGPGVQDAEFANSITKVCDVINIVGLTQPKQLLAVISMARLVICPDTGPAHMAASVGTKVIALHAVTDPNISGPYNYQNLAVNFYPKALKDIMGIDAKNAKWGTQVHDKRAMLMIKPKHVIPKIESLLG